MLNISKTMDPGPLHQETIQHAFQFLFENKSDLTKEKLESLLKSSFPLARSFQSNSSTNSSMYRPTTPTSSLGESFTYSPSNPSPAPHCLAKGSPLQEFLKTHHAKKVLDSVQKELRE